MRKIEALQILKNIIKKAYCPYSNFPVAALVEDNNGEYATGINVENASFGLTVCAERIAMFNFVVNGFKNPVRLFLYAPTEDFTPPCGACRQVLAEFNPDMEIILFNKEENFTSYKLSELLPQSFSGENLKGKQ
ncbi:cytidine deaminase [Thermotomaculum hydrothermale]|uniref:Cytidine deaminase n=1 Tax=Thermotomaculum hydrothermale TaxID=981385 RepID=A0A7R6SZL4_9BACT|nr:cytidine deaminase [Thermotomaculum hydrothermale]BBB32955.1 cytidine deaminase [Thermotomaculum hydrothermale]